MIDVDNSKTTPIVKCIETENLLEDPKVAKKLRKKAASFCLFEKNLLRKDMQSLC